MSNGSSSHRGGCSYFSFFFSADLPTLWPRVQAAIIYNGSSRPTLVPVRRNRNRNGRHMRNGLYITEDRDIMRRTTNSCIRMRRQCDDCLSFNYYLIASRLPTLAAIPRKRAHRSKSITENYYSNKTLRYVRNSTLARFKYPCIRLFALTE